MAACATWQEREWARFTAAHPEFAVTLEQLAEVLRICELHGNELLPDVVPVVHGCRDYTDRYIKARNRLFPHASSQPVYTEGAPFEGERHEAWYCPQCRQAEAEWRAENE